MVIYRRERLSALNQKKFVPTDGGGYPVSWV
jgi:hypothetical protein